MRNILTTNKKNVAKSTTLLEFNAEKTTVKLSGLTNVIGDDWNVSRDSIGSRTNSSGLVEIYGPQLVINGTFDTNLDNWVSSEATWTISGATFNYSGGYAEIFRQDSVPVVGLKTYRLSFDMVRTTGYLQPFLANISQTTYNSTGYHEMDITMIGSPINNILGFNTTGFVGSITNISIIELTTQNDTPRIDYTLPPDTIITYGPELVDNGGFSNGLAGWTTDRGTISVIGGELSMIDTEANGAYAFSTLNAQIVSGTTYQFEIDVELSGASSYSFSYGNTGGSSTGGEFLTITTNGHHTWQHTATSTGTKYISVVHITSNIGDSSLTDNISMREVIVNDNRLTTTYGPELFLNNDFELGDNGDWIKSNGTISGGTGNLDGVAFASALLFQSHLTQFVTYKVEFDVTNYTAGENRVMNDSGSELYPVTSNGHHNFVFTHAHPSPNLIWRSRSGGQMSIDNVSVKEVIVTDTSYITSYGDEMIVNGNFDTDTTGWSVANGSINVVGGQLKLSATGILARAYQTIVGLEVGKNYRLTYDVTDSTAGKFGVRINNNTDPEQSTDFGVGKIRDFTFTSGTRLDLYGDYDETSGIVYYNNISLKEIVSTYNGTAKVLVEDEVENLFPYSEDFSDASWLKLGGSSIIPNTVISPDGTQNASTFSAGTSAYGGILRDTISKSDATEYTISLYVKKGNHRYIGVRVGTAVGGSDTYNFYDFDTDSVDNTNYPEGPITRRLLGNGWIKLTQTATMTSTSNNSNDVAIVTALGETEPAPAGTEYVYIWGAQLELGSGSSYIFTSGSTVTRSSDSISIIPPSGTTFIEEWVDNVKQPDKVGKPALYQMKNHTTKILMNNTVIKPTNEIYPDTNAASVWGEVDSIDGWVNGNGNSTCTSVDPDITEPSDGNYCIEVKTIDSGTNNWWGYTFNVEAGSIYDISAKVKRGAYFGNQAIGVYGTGLPNDLFYINDVDWETYSYSGVANNTGTSQLRIYANTNDATFPAEMYLDELSIKNLGKPNLLEFDASNTTISGTGGLGPELLVNGDFSHGDTGWNVGSGWTITGGEAVAVTPPGVISQTVLTTGTTYQVSYDMTFTSGFFRWRCGWAGQGELRSSSGSYTEQITCSGSTIFDATGGTFEGSIQNVSVRELVGSLGNVVGDDWDVYRPSRATFVNDSGIIEDATHIVGPVTVDNADFELGDNGDWSTINLSISGGTANLDATSSLALLYQDVGLTIGKSYLVEFDITNFVFGNLEYNDTIVFENSGPRKYSILGNGHHSYIHNHNDVSGNILFKCTNNGQFSVDNVVIKEIIIEHVPRIQDGKVLIESENTNLLFYSEMFFDWWFLNEVTINSGYLAPNGTITATKLTESSAVDVAHRIQGVNVDVISGTTYIMSVFAKAGEHDFLHITNPNGAVISTTATFDLVNGTLGTVLGGTANMEDYGNGWYRCSVYNVALQDSNTKLYMYGTPTDNVGYYPTWSGDGTSGIYIWGAELKMGTGVDSYIGTFLDAVETRESDVITTVVPSGATESIAWINSIKQRPKLVQPGSIFKMSNGTTKLNMY